VGVPDAWALKATGVPADALWSEGSSVTVGAVPSASWPSRTGPPFTPEAAVTPAVRGRSSTTSRTVVRLPSVCVTVR
jgi:hypothetical protein